MTADDGNHEGQVETKGVLTSVSSELRSSYKNVRFASPICDSASLSSAQFFSNVSSTGFFFKCILLIHCIEL